MSKSVFTNRRKAKPVFWHCRSWGGYNLKISSPISRSSYVKFKSRFCCIILWIEIKLFFCYFRGDDLWWFDYLQLCFDFNLLESTWFSQSDNVFFITLQRWFYKSNCAIFWSKITGSLTNDHRTQRIVEVTDLQQRDFHWRG